MLGERQIAQALVVTDDPIGPSERPQDERARQPQATQDERDPQRGLGAGE